MSAKRPLSTDGPAVKRETSPANLGRRRVCFEVEADPGSRVAVAGSFNRWDPEKHVLKQKSSDGHYQRVLFLPPGDYEYKFVIDGDWSADPNCEHFAANEFGTLNSVLHVNKPAKQRSRS